MNINHLKRTRKPDTSGSAMVLDGVLVHVTNQPNQALVEFMAQTGQFPERANGALRELWNRYSQQLCGAVARRNHEFKPLDHEQAVNDAFLNAFQHAADFLPKLQLLPSEQKDAAVVAWIWKIATNRLKDQMRKRTLDTVQLDGVDIDLTAKECVSAWESRSCAPSPEAPSLTAQVWAKRIERIRASLRRMSYRDRTILVESYRHLDHITGSCVIPAEMRSHLRQELGTTDSNLRRRRAWLVDKLSVEMLALELKHCGHARITPEMIGELCKKVGISEKRLLWFVTRISKQILKI